MTYLRLARPALRDPRPQGPTCLDLPRVPQNSNDTYEFLSGVKVTPASTFLALNQPDQLAFFKDVIHYMR